jgi:ABC-2 type transport system ATP-binding protein
VLTASHLHKEFASTIAVDDVSFHVQPGQIFGLIGPNGAGKSTTIRMIMDILEPDAGSMEIDGRPAAAVVRNISGYLPEERGLYRKSRVSHVIDYFAALKGLPRREARLAAAPWLERFGLGARAERNVEELSKGNQQKLQFIIAVLHRPRLLVLDELFSGLDPVNQELMKDALLELKQDNRAIVFSTHMMEHAEMLCDDLVLIDRGRVVLSGPPGDIKRRHGRNAVHMEFDGDGGLLERLPGVRSARVSGRFAELDLAEDADTNTLLADVLPHLRIARFARVEPSLHAIFIQTVGAHAHKDAREEQP